jgi:hypothetical protein
VPSSLSRSDRELSEGREGSVRRGNSFPGLRSGADGALFCAASQREIAESLGVWPSAEVMLDVPDPPDVLCMASPSTVTSKVLVEPGLASGVSAGVCAWGLLHRRWTAKMQVQCPNHRNPLSRRDPIYCRGLAAPVICNTSAALRLCQGATCPVADKGLNRARVCNSRD